MNVWPGKDATAAAVYKHTHKVPVQHPAVTPAAPYIAGSRQARCPECQGWGIGWRCSGVDLYLAPSAGTRQWVGLKGVMMIKVGVNVSQLASTLLESVDARSDA